MPACLASKCLLGAAAAAVLSDVPNFKSVFHSLPSNFSKNLRCYCFIFAHLKSSWFHVIILYMLAREQVHLNDCSSGFMRARLFICAFLSLAAYPNEVLFHLFFMLVIAFHASHAYFLLVELLKGLPEVEAVTALGCQADSTVHSPS
jgi:hypothetical protein